MLGYHKIDCLIWHIRFLVSQNRFCDTKNHNNFVISNIYFVISQNQITQTLNDLVILKKKIEFAICPFKKSNLWYPFKYASIVSLWLGFNPENPFSFQTIINGWLEFFIHHTSQQQLCWSKFVYLARTEQGNYWGWLISRWSACGQ